jgi:hypothetical protein
VPVLNGGGASIDPGQPWKQAQCQVTQDLENAEQLSHIEQIGSALVSELDLGPGEKTFFGSDNQVAPPDAT